MACSFHINFNKQDNRLENLRYVTQRENVVSYIKLNSAKLIGAQKHGNGWRAAISINGKRINLGSFKTEIEAHEAYIKVTESLPSDVAY